MEIYSLSFFLLVSVGLILYYTVFSRCQWICLLGLSLLFFTASGWKGLVFLLFTALTIWLGGLQLAKLDADSAARRKAPGISKDEKKAIKAQAVRRKKCLVAAVLTANFLVLGYFKYWSYFAELLSGAFSATAPSSLGLVMPLGISFYTFSAGGYLIDVYRGTVAPERSLLTFGTYLTMFPKLVSGPIASYAQLQPEFGTRDVSLRQAVDGLKLFVFGMAFKILLANQLGGLWSDVTTIGFESLSTPLAWMAAFAYSFQLYFDFWGYSLMAIGIGRMLGFHLPENFRQPFFSASVKELWARWHISLSQWFRDYVYIPLGGNRKGIARRDANLLLTFLVSGLWHGANWTFLVWGGLHGLCQVAEDHMPAPLRKRKSLPLRIVGVPLTFAIFVTTFTIFRASSLGNAAAYFAGILHNPGHEVFAQYWLLGLTSKLELLLLLLGIALLVLVDVLHECGLHLRAWVNAAPRPVRWAVYEFAIFAFLLMASFYSNTGFLYARF